MRLLLKGKRMKFRFEQPRKMRYTGASFGGRQETLRVQVEAYNELVDQIDYMQDVIIGLHKEIISLQSKIGENNEVPT